MTGDEWRTAHDSASAEAPGTRARVRFALRALQLRGAYVAGGGDSEGDDERLLMLAASYVAAVGLAQTLSRLTPDVSEGARRRIARALARVADSGAVMPDTAVLTEVRAVVEAMPEGL